MTDEAAVLLRVSCFGFLVAVVYWFISYEPLGTLGFLVLGGAPGFAGLYLVLHQPRDAESLWDRLRRLAGLPAPDRKASRAELAADDLGVLPQASIWPFVLGLGATLGLTGLALGLWPLLLGAGLTGMAAVGWQLAVNREQRYGRVARGDPGVEGRDRVEDPEAARRD